MKALILAVLIGIIGSLAFAENLTIVSTYTDTKENIAFFAMSNGWTPTITSDTGEIIANPVTLEQFVSDWGMKNLSTQLSRPAKDYIEQRAIEQMNSAKATVTAQIESRLSVEVK